jgi:hypothetical protein
MYKELIFKLICHLVIEAFSMDILSFLASRNRIFTLLFVRIRILSKKNMYFCIVTSAQQLVSLKTCWYTHM